MPNAMEANGAIETMASVIPVAGASAPSHLASHLAAYAPIVEDLQRFESRFRQEMRSSDPAVSDLAQYSLLLGGKRLRPALVLLSAKACGAVMPEHTLLAVIVEMIHTATLVHDDIIDEAEIRRHVPTINRRWDAPTAVLLGDFLFSHAFYLASTFETTFAAREIGKSTNLVCEGEIRQKLVKGNVFLSEAEYLQIITAKTGELCACACRLGAHFASVNAEQVEAFTEFGRLVGTAFQIADDILDVAGDEKIAGKTLGTDLAEQRMTLPVIRLLERSNSEIKKQIVQLLAEGSTASRRQLRHRLQDSGVLTESRVFANGLISRALELLSPLPPSPALESLRQLAKFAIDRQA
jgi:octaprenyl-diphosphate synthase